MTISSQQRYPVPSIDYILLWTESILLEEMSCLGAEVRLNHGLDDSNVDVSRHIVAIDTSILASSNVDRRE